MVVRNLGGGNGRTTPVQVRRGKETKWEQRTSGSKRLQNIERIRVATRGYPLFGGQTHQTTIAKDKIHEGDIEEESLIGGRAPGHKPKRVGSGANIEGGEMLGVLDRMPKRVVRGNVATDGRTTRTGYAMAELGVPMDTRSGLRAAVIGPTSGFWLSGTDDGQERIQLQAAAHPGRRLIAGQNTSSHNWSLRASTLNGGDDVMKPALAD
ncbi:hypothetical protein FB45DRAFT_881016 [Roridomyces roridus]|uniref:Uncharacterized protein n=1 Tax=Roridomyces roridus TaxID=1738132 RepID=A0AAD7F8G4_9AGAR|nr:hypothetical protein FB45DRAFT_881016 [Roridomyces roridus]